MNKNTLLFILLSSLILMTASILQSIYYPPKPAPNLDAVADAGLVEPADAENGTGEDGADAPAQPNTEAPAAQNPAAENPTSDSLEPESQVQDPALANTPVKKTGAEANSGASQKDPEKLLTIGSVAPDSTYRYLVTVDTVGAAVRRLELNFPKKNKRPKYRDFETPGAYIGELDVVETIDGMEVRVVGAGTPAAAAGIEVGDQIQSVAGKGLDSVIDYRLALADLKPGKAIEVGLARAGEKMSLQITPTRKPIELIRPEPDRLEQGVFGESSFLTMLRTREEDGDWHLIDQAMKTAAWKVESISEQTMKLSYTLTNSVLEPVNLKGPIKVIKTFSLPELDAETLRDSNSESFHVEFDLEIVNQSQGPLQLGLEIGGPWGTPSETWWYQNKIHGDTWAIGSIAGARDITGASEEESFVFQGGPQLVKNALKDTPEYMWVFDNHDRNPLSRTVKNIGVDTQYFNVSMIPTGEEPLICYSALAVPAQVAIPKKDTRRQKLVDCSFQLFKDVDLQAGQTYKQTFNIFGGPKEKEVLEAYGLLNNRAFGWFGWCSKPLCWLLGFFYKVTFQLGYGIPIIILTVIVRSLMIPISRKVALNAQMLQYLQPQMKAINEKYKDEFEKKAQAQRELFKKYKYNPLSGCFMMPLQLPIFIGLYRGLSVDIALRDQPLIPGLSWCSNLAAPDQFFYWGNWMPSFLGGETGWLGPYFNLLPIIACVLFMLQQKLFTPAAVDEQGEMMQKVMKYMGVVMAVMFFKMPSGLVLYFITSSVWSILERKMLPKPKLDTAGLGALDLDGLDAEEVAQKKTELLEKQRQIETQHEQTVAEKKRKDRERKKRLKHRGA